MECQLTFGFFMPHVGDRIRFLARLSCGPNEDTPGNLYAEKGGLGTIDRVGGCWEGFWVFWDGWKHAPFGCEEKDFVLLYGDDK